MKNKLKLIAKTNLSKELSKCISIMLFGPTSKRNINKRCKICGSKNITTKKVYSDEHSDLLKIKCNDCKKEIAVSKLRGSTQYFEIH